MVDINFAHLSFLIFIVRRIIFETCTRQGSSSSTPSISFQSSIMLLYCVVCSWIMSFIYIQTICFAILFLLLVDESICRDTRQLYTFVDWMTFSGSINVIQLQIIIVVVSCILFFPNSKLNNDGKYSTIKFFCFFFTLFNSIRSAWNYLEQRVYFTNNLCK